MAKIVRIDEEKVRIRTESGKEAEVGISSLNFSPQIGDEIEVSKNNGKVIVSKKKGENDRTESLVKTSQKTKKKKSNTKLIIICILIGMSMDIALSNSDKDDNEEEIENLTDDKDEVTSPIIEEYSQERIDDSVDGPINEEESQGVTDVKVQNKNGDIDNFRYGIEGSTIYLEEYIADADYVELKTTYTVDGIEYLTDISEFNSRGSYTKLIIDEGFTEVSTGIFNGSYVDKVFFPKSMTNVYDYTLAYMHNGEKNKIYYAGTKEEWLNIFTRYKRKKVSDTEFGEEWGQAVADKLNEMIGVEYDSSNFEYFFSASPDDLK